STCTFERDRRRAVSDAMHAASREIARSVGGSPAWSAGALGQDRPSLDRYAGALAAAERIALASDAPEAVADAIRFMAARSGVWIADARVRGAEDRTGYLGVDFDADHAGPGLRIAGVLPGGPSDDIASGPTAGEYVHSIDGTPCSSGETAWAHLVGRAGREVALVVAPTAPSATEDAVAGVRTVRVRAMGREAELRLRDRAWSQEQAARVASLSSGVVKYVRVRGFDPEDVRRLAGDLRSDVGRARAFIVDLRDLDSAGDPAHALAAILDRRWSGVDDASGAGARDIPLALLVNERTIGCAEAVALAVQAAGRGALVGGQMPGFAVRTRRFDALEEVQITLADRSYTDRSGRSLVGLFTSIPGGFVREPDRQLEAAVSAALSLAHEVARPVLPR
ncbi:MAG: hypothetical protein FJX72_20500, partial [Armatimonadetes bacterium]|nr:hypothetical protein [Armatimonadota bacterium]